MNSTVYEELTRELNLFAKNHNLIVAYDPFDKERPDEWGFTLYNRERTWGYRRLFTDTDLRHSRLDPYTHANMILNDIRSRLKTVL